MKAGRPPSKSKSLKKWINNEWTRPGAIKPVDWELIEKWVIAGASGIQVAAALNIHAQTLYDRAQKDHQLTWTEWAREKTEKGNRMLHNKQFEKAMNGSERMLIWLGKQRLNQTEKIDQNIETKGETTQKVILQLPDNGRRNPT